MSSAPVVLHPMDLGEILDNVFRIYRARFPLLAGLAVLVSLPTLLLQYLLGSFAQAGFLIGSLGRFATGATSIGQPPATELTSGSLLGLGAGYLVVLLLFPFSIATVLRAAGYIVLGEPADVGRVLRGVLDRYLALWAYVIVFGAFSLVTILLCVTIPLWVWVAVPWAGVGLPVLLMERAGPFHCLSRGFDLVRGYWWRTLGILLVIYLLSSAVSYVIFLFVGVIAAIAAFLPLPDVAKGGIFYSGTVISSALLAPIVEVGRVLVYLDLRVRNEAFDLQRLAQQVPPA